MSTQSETHAQGEVDELAHGARVPWKRELVIALFVGVVLAVVFVGRALWDGDRVFFAVDTGAGQSPWSAASMSAADSALPIVDADTGGAAKGADSAGRGRGVEPVEPTRSADPAARGSNRELSDQGVAFYPAYRWTARKIAAGEWPTWNDGLDLGVPWLANPQWGVLDPQVLALAALERFGGEAAFLRGFAWLAALRVLLAASGAYLLARRLALGRIPALFAAVAFTSSGAIVLWINSSVGHVAPFLPWMCLGLEAIRRADSVRARRLATALTAVSFLLAILGGHPETSFFVGLAGGAWAASFWRADRSAARHGLAALALGTCAGGAMLVPFVEYLANSGAWLAHRLTPRTPIDLVAVGLACVVLALFLRWRALASGARERAGASHGPRFSADSNSTAGVVGVLLALFAWAWIVGARGDTLGARLALLFDLFGHPGLEPWRGAGTFVEQASAWASIATWGLALSAVFQPRSVLPARPIVAVFALIAALLAMRVPGIVDAWRLVPGFGLGAPARAAPIAALFVALIAAGALQHASRFARRAAVVALVGFVAIASIGRGAPARPANAPAVDPDDELVGWIHRPVSFDARSQGAGVPDVGAGRAEAPIELWVHPALAVVANLVVERLDGLPDAGARHELALSAKRIVDDDERVREGRIPRGATLFTGPSPDTHAFEAGWWSWRVEFVRRVGDEGRASQADGSAVPSASADPRQRERLGVRVGAVTCVHAEPELRRTSLAFGIATSLLLLFVRRRSVAIELAWVALAFGQGLVFARGWLESVPRASGFHATQAESVIASEQGLQRVLGDPGVFPENTALVGGLLTLSGYDALDPVSFDLARGFVLRRGAHPLVDWNAAGAELDAPATRLFGLDWLALSGPRPLPAWELVAGPGRGAARAPREAEVWIYRRREASPRAFFVKEIVERRALLADAQPWRPFEQAFLDDGEAWRPVRPFETAHITRIEWTDERVRAEATLDGDGLLVFSAQAYPGWEARVDGAPARLLTVDSLLRGVPLGAGAHVVELVYRPWTVRVGAILSCMALVGVLGLVLAASGFRRHPAVMRPE